MKIQCIGFLALSIPCSVCSILDIGKPIEELLEDGRKVFLEISHDDGVDALESIGQMTEDFKFYLLDSVLEVTRTPETGSGLFQAKRLLMCLIALSFIKRDFPDPISDYRRQQL